MTAYATIDLESALVAGVRGEGYYADTWMPLWDLPEGARHGDRIPVIVVLGCLAVARGTGAEVLEEIRREYRRARGKK